MNLARLWCKIVGHDRIIIEIDAYHCRRCGAVEVLHNIRWLRDVLLNHRERDTNGTITRYGE